MEKMTFYNNSISLEEFQSNMDLSIFNNIEKQLEENNNQDLEINLCMKIENNKTYNSENKSFIEDNKTYDSKNKSFSKRIKSIFKKK